MINEECYEESFISVVDVPYKPNLIALLPRIFATVIINYIVKEATFFKIPQQQQDANAAAYMMHYEKPLQAIIHDLECDNIADNRYYPNFCGEQFRIYIQNNRFFLEMSLC